MKLSVKCDEKFALELLHRAEILRLPVVGANYGTSKGHSSDMPMDRGTLVPLWFPLRERKLKAQVVIVTPSREIPLARNFEFGRVIAKLAEKKKGSTFVFIASADQAHAHLRKRTIWFQHCSPRV